jgi:hypothetical protein
VETLVLAAIVFTLKLYLSGRETGKPCWKNLFIQDLVNPSRLPRRGLHEPDLVLPQ